MNKTVKNKTYHGQTVKRKRPSSVLMIGSSMTKNIKKYCSVPFSFHAKSGYTSSDVLLWIQRCPEKISAFETIILFIGNNDTDVGLFERNLREIIRLLANVRRTIVITPTRSKNGDSHNRCSMREIVLQLSDVNVEIIDLWKKIGMSELDSSNHLNRRGNQTLLNMVNEKLTGKVRSHNR